MGPLSLYLRQRILKASELNRSTDGPHKDLSIFWLRSMLGHGEDWTSQGCATAAATSAVRCAREAGSDRRTGATKERPAAVEQDLAPGARTYWSRTPARSARFARPQTPQSRRRRNTPSKLAASLMCVFARCRLHERRSQPSDDHRKHRSACDQGPHTMRPPRHVSRPFMPATLLRSRTAHHGHTIVSAA